MRVTAEVLESKILANGRVKCPCIGCFKWTRTLPVSPALLSYSPLSLLDIRGQGVNAGTGTALLHSESLRFKFIGELMGVEQRTKHQSASFLVTFP